MPKRGFIPNKLKPWIDARKKYKLSHSQVEMARSLGLNPKKLGGMANNDQESWKMPLPEYIEHLYQKRYGEIITDIVKPLARIFHEGSKKVWQNSQYFVINQLVK
jgi:hypothetical protein